MWCCKTSALCCHSHQPWLAPDLLRPHTCGKRGNKCTPAFLLCDEMAKDFRQKLPLAGSAQHLLK